MVRASQATTFSSESYFDDRGAHGYAQPITEHVNVREFTCICHDISSFHRPAPFATYRVILFPGGRRWIPLWCKSTFDTSPDLD